MMTGLSTPQSRAVVERQRVNDVEYAQMGGESLRLDGSIPGSGGAVPAVIVVHGGGWVRGDRRIDVQPFFNPLAKGGFAWFSIDYRLANDISEFGTAIEDVEAAIRFVKAHAAEYHIDPNRLALVGESAGGQLAAMAALSREPDLHVSAVVAFYTPSDLAALAKSSNLIPPQIRDSLRGTPFEQFITARLAQLSPINSVRAGMPPFLLIHGTADNFVPFAQSEAMCTRMKEVGASCEVYAVRGAGHGVRWWESNANAAGYKQKMVEWLQTQFAAAKFNQPRQLRRVA